MFEFIVSLIAIAFTYVMLMSYIPTNSTKKKPAWITKRRVNAVTGTPVFEIITFVGVFVLIGSGGLGMLMVALGLGVGLSLVNKAYITRLGKDKFWR